MSVENCRNNLDDHALHSLNVAVAYWISEEQEKESNEGYLLYALAEKAQKQDFYQITLDRQKFDEKSVGQFADSRANDLFQLFQYDDAIDASVVLNLWMYTVYNLHMSVENYRNNLNDHALHSLNVAVAYWIGKRQKREAIKVIHYML